MTQQLFAPVGTKTYVMPQTQYLMVYSDNNNVRNFFHQLEHGRELKKCNEKGKKRRYYGQKPRPELFAFKTPQSRVKIFNLNKLSLTIVARMLKKYPDEIMIFIGPNYWFHELPQEIQDNVNNFNGNIKHIENKIKEEAVTTCSNGSKQ